MLLHWQFRNAIGAVHYEVPKGRLRVEGAALLELPMYSLPPQTEMETLG